ncbi:hypothetical protein PR202_ga16641 [Eleusine coracana subsp. coracana]|uniref:Translation initiation factor eIF2B subunit epsilon n=1 Tax=Eleusine coracana subsp. coracana TaxID=191504 RepID=A0AAV5CM01_ELECO|nr:hypothetical protein PR202_ga16641 [Eleusine coracana subsp. coracana]
MCDYEPVAVRDDHLGLAVAWRRTAVGTHGCERLLKKHEGEKMKGISVLFKPPEFPTNVILSHSAQIGANSVVGSATNIGDHCKISNSVIGEGCKIEKNVVINGSYIWDNVIIEDGCKVNYSLICDGVHLRAGAVVEFGSILSFKVEVGKNVTIPAHSKVSLLPQPSNEDSDEELEYADTSSGVTDSPSLSSTRSNGDQVTAPSEEEDSGTSDETGTSGVVGYIWTSGDSGVLEEWRQSIAPIPKEKLEEMRHACSAGDDDGSEGELNNPTVPDSDNESADAIDDEDDPFAKFEKEVEETFQRALNGVSQDNLILEINGLRLSYSLQHADCAGAVFYSVTKSALVAAQSTNDTLLKTTAEALGKWKDLLRNYAKTVDEEMEILLKFEEMCQETTKEFTPLFSKILPFLYDKEIVSEDAILRWAEEKEHADESDKVFVKQSEAFIQAVCCHFPLPSCTRRGRPAWLPPSAAAAGQSANASLKPMNMSWVPKCKGVSSLCVGDKKTSLTSDSSLFGALDLYWEERMLPLSLILTEIETDIETDIEKPLPLPCLLPLSSATALLLEGGDGKKRVMKIQTKNLLSLLRENGASPADVAAIATRVPAYTAMLIDGVRELDELNLWASWSSSSAERSVVEMEMGGSGSGGRCTTWVMGQSRHTVGWCRFSRASVCGSRSSSSSHLNVTATGLPVLIQRVREFRVNLLDLHAFSFAPKGYFMFICVLAKL